VDPSGAGEGRREAGHAEEGAPGATAMASPPPNPWLPMSFGFVAGGQPRGGGALVPP
jgi:hypothetical protein